MFTIGATASLLMEQRTLKLYYCCNKNERRRTKRKIILNHKSQFEISILACGNCKERKKTIVYQEF